MKDKHQVKAKSFTTKHKERKEERNKEREREKGKV